MKNVKGDCPRCDEKALYLSIDANGNVSVACNPPSGCDLQAAVSFQEFMEYVDDDQLPVLLKTKQ